MIMHICTSSSLFSLTLLELDRELAIRDRHRNVAIDQLQLQATWILLHFQINFEHSYRERTVELYA